MKLGFFEKLSMYLFFEENKDKPYVLASEYRKNQSKWEALKREYPEWRKYTRKYPELCSTLRKLGVPL